jgi:hypothetical protein
VIGANDRLAIFFGGKAFAAGFCGTLFHGRLQSNTFNRANFRKTGMAKDEARFAVADNYRRLARLSIKGLWPTG